MSIDLGKIGKGIHRHIKEQDYQFGVKDERERIRANILDRVSDLNACSKKDNCNELARLIESYIPEWLDGENE